VLGPDHDPKSLISRLEEAGAVRLEKRNGYPYDYTVLIMHEDHPDVQEIRAELESQPSYGDGYYDDSYADTYDDASSSYDADDSDAAEYEDTDVDDSADDVEAYDASYDDSTWEEEEEHPS
jgi:hypothetical protein